MNSQLLLPNRWKRIGWIILIPTTLAGIIVIINQFEISWLHTKVFALYADNIMVYNAAGPAPKKYFVFTDLDVTLTLIGTLFIIGGLLVAFSKEKIEDEFIVNLRLSSLLWSVWVSYFLLLLSFILIYGTAFLQVMIYNMFTILIIFIARFNFILYRNSKMATDEK